MLKVIHHNITPPNGWRDINPTMNFPFVANNFEELVEKERRYFIANKRSVPPDLSAQIENRLCHQMPPGICESSDGEIYRGGKARASSTTVLNATRNINDRLHRCSPEIAVARAILCYACEHNASSRACPTCTGIAAALREMLDGRSTVWDSKLQVCDILGVYTKVLVHVANPLVGSVEKEKTAKECWLRNT